MAILRNRNLDGRIGRTPHREQSWGECPVLAARVVPSVLRGIPAFSIHLSLRVVDLVAPSTLPFQPVPGLHHVNCRLPLTRGRRACPYRTSSVHPWIYFRPYERLAHPRGGHGLSTTREVVARLVGQAWMGSALQTAQEGGVCICQAGRSRTGLASGARCRPSVCPTNCLSHAGACGRGISDSVRLGVLRASIAPGSTACVALPVHRISTDFHSLDSWGGWLLQPNALSNQVTSTAPRSCPESHRCGFSCESWQSRRE